MGKHTACLIVYRKVSYGKIHSLFSCLQLPNFQNKIDVLEDALLSSTHSFTDVLSTEVKRRVGRKSHIGTTADTLQKFVPLYSTLYFEAKFLKLQLKFNAHLMEWSSIVLWFSTV